MRNPRTYAEETESGKVTAILSSALYTILFGLSLTLLGVVFVQTFSDGLLLLAVVAVACISVSALIYYLGLEMIFNKHV